MSRTTVSLLRKLVRVVAIAVALLGAAIVYIVQPTTARAVETVSIDAARLERHVRMLSETLAPRDAGQPERLDAVAAYIRAEFARSGARVSEQPYPVEGATYRNVVASFGPADGEVIVVGAHYDACDALPGADDNASGVAGLIELAQALGKKPPRRRVDLVAYSLEEPPYFRTEHMGSAVHAASLKAAQVPVRAMIALEMIGYFTDMPESQRFPVPAMRALYPTTGNFIAVVGGVGGGSLVARVKSAMAGASDLPVYSMNAPSALIGVDWSDHRSYWAQGYDAVMVTDTAFFRNTAYHTAQDTADRLDYARMAKVVAGVYAAVVDFDKK
ncbi:MAG TPA: M28 family peptidase [Tahibacter sp.]|nr:M28 family peptidase [Tahibacter sp.]